MFAKTIIDSDAFLDQPLTTQALYFHLAMRADDDGFVNNPKKIQRMVGCSDDDLKLLLAKQFILAFDSGVIVIKHWKIHNYIRSDRYKPTVYKEEKAMLQTKENNAYTFGIPSDNQAVDNWDTQVRLVKERLVKERLNNNNEMDVDLSTEIFELSTDERSIANIILQQWHYQPTEDDIEQAIEQLKRLNNDFNLFETALGISAEYGERACNWRYLSKIIDNWIAKGYQTEEDILMHELSRKSNAYLKHQNRMER